MHRILGLFGALTLIGCQTGPINYARIGPGPELEYANAQCEIAAMGTDRGVFAMGSASYVAGAQLGNAISNEMRRQQFMKNCMVMQGWRAEPVKTSRAAESISTATVPREVVVTDGKYPGPPPPPKPAS